MTSDQLADATATFDSRAEALAAANAALPRRTKHNRPYPISYGYLSARLGRNVWIVIVGNAVLLRDGTMYDHLRQQVIG